MGIKEVDLAVPTSGYFANGRLLNYFTNAFDFLVLCFLQQKVVKALKGPMCPWPGCFLDTTYLDLYRIAGPASHAGFSSLPVIQTNVSAVSEDTFMSLNLV